MAQESGNLEQILLALTSSDPGERADAVENLRYCNDPNAVAALVTAIEDPDKGVRELAAETLIARRSPDAPAYLCQYLSSPDITQRNLASEVLTKLGALSVDALCDAAHDPDHDVRKFAVDILGTIGDPRALHSLLMSLEDANQNVVCSAAEALGMLGSADALEALLATFETKAFARPQIIDALGQIGDTRALPLLVEAIHANDPIVVYSAVEAMGSMHSRRVEPYLRELLVRGDEALQEAAIGSLIRVAHSVDHAVLDNLPVAIVQLCLNKAIRSGDKKTKLFAIAELRHWEGPATVSVLLEALNDPDEEVMIAARETLSLQATSASDRIAEALIDAPARLICNLLDTIGATGNSRFVQDIVSLASHHDETVREKVAFVLGKIGDQTILDYLMALAVDPVGHVRSAALKALGWIGADKAIDSLFTALDDPFPDVRQAALGALVLSGGDDAIRRFRLDLNHADPHRQIIAAQALGWIGEASVIEPLVEALRHPEWEVRKSAVESLGRSADVSALQHIKVLLNDEEPQVRKSTIDAIIALGGGDSWKDITCMLEDEDLWVRFHAINGLGSIGNREALEELIPFLTSESDILRVAAAKSLARLHDKRALPFLKETVNDRNPDVVGAVVGAIDRLESL